MGAAAAFYALEALDEMHAGKLGNPGVDTAAVVGDTWLVVSMVVVASTLVHAITGVPATLLLHKNMVEKEKPDELEWDREAGV